MKRLKLYGVLYVYGFVLVLIVAFLCSGCSSAQWQKTKAHAVEVGFAGAGGAGAVAIGGPAGPFIFFGMSVLGVLVNEQLQPPEATTVVTKDEKGNVTKVEHFQPRERSGDSQYSSEHWYERVWTAVQVAWWVFVLLFILTHAKLRSALMGFMAWAWGFAGRKASHLVGMLKKKT